MEPATAPETVTDAPSPGRLKLRFAIFVVSVLFLEAGPCAKQALKLDTPLRAWQMFHIKAADICDVDFIVRRPDGSEARPSVEEVVRATRLENRNREGSYYRLKNIGEIRRAGRALCSLRQGSEVHAVARCGHPEKGWVPAMDGEEDLCGPPR